MKEFVIQYAKKLIKHRATVKKQTFNILYSYYTKQITTHILPHTVLKTTSSAVVMLEATNQYMVICLAWNVLSETILEL